MSIEQAELILIHLYETAQQYCFTLNGEIISRDDCYKVLNQEVTL